MIVVSDDGGVEFICVRSIVGDDGGVEVMDVIVVSLGVGLIQGEGFGFGDDILDKPAPSIN